MFKNRYFLLIPLLIVVVLVSCKDKEVNEVEVISNEDLNSKEIIKEQRNNQIEELISTMTLEEKISQLFILGFEGTSVDERLNDLLVKEKIGGLIYFDRNIESYEQLKTLNQEILNLNRDSDNIGLFISIDEESKRVSRLSSIYGILPSLSEIGAVNDQELSYEYGRYLGVRLASLNFNLNFAPVVDINSNLGNSVMGDRAFGSDVSVVKDNYMEIVNGQKEFGVISAIKHFPGHGDTKTDSHIDIPVIDKTKTELYDLELIPYIDAISNNIDMIMVGHLLVPELDDKIASASNKVINGLLREELGFKGVIISDDLNMNAVYKNDDSINPAYEFILSGGDIALVCHDVNLFYKTKERIISEVADGTLDEEIIDEKVLRILSLKNKYNISDVNINKYTEDEVYSMKEYFNTMFYK